MPPSDAAPAPNPRSRARRAWIGFALCLVAPLAWMATLDVPVLRSTGAAAWVLIAVGCVLTGSAAAVDRRRWILVLLALQCAFVGLFAWASFGFARLPEVRVAREVGRIADFSLRDERGQTVVLSEELRRGPVLLVFFRGHW
jgi:hypothetical protein